MSRLEHFSINRGKAGLATVLPFGLLSDDYRTTPAGFVVLVPAILVVHFRSPRVDPAVLVLLGDRDTERYFEIQYSKTLRSRQVAAIWTEAIVGFIPLLFAMCAGLGLVMA